MKTRQASVRRLTWREVAPQAYRASDGTNEFEVSYFVWTTAGVKQADGWSCFVNGVLFDEADTLADAKWYCENVNLAGF